jgi:maltooligosyltrehalose trehalohydrolase
LTALLLLAPSTPMLFQGQEFAASSPFYFFADHEEELARLIRKGRAEFLSQFRSVATREARSELPAPEDLATFERCKLDFSERARNSHAYRMHRDLLRLRREDPTFAAQARRGIDGAVLAHEAFVLRFFGAADGGDGGGGATDRLLVVNLGPDLNLNPAPEPLLAPPDGMVWTRLWSSEDPRYGGGGTPPLETHYNWNIPGHAAFAMRPAPAGEAYDPARGGDQMSEEEETRTEALKGWNNE